MKDFQQGGSWKGKWQRQHEETLKALREQAAICERLIQNLERERDKLLMLKGLARLYKELAAREQDDEPP